jgi:2-polyprenyl-3-methyl-5-hydroxy-6-metoxy-1,4-benzoquinol methylase
VPPTGEYAERGDYHRRLDPHWSYAPIYERKLLWVDGVLEGIPKEARVLDAGAGEGALVERYRERGFDVVGVDTAYESAHVERASLLALPFEDESFDVVLCLDVLEHVELLAQPKAVSELARVSKKGARLLLSVPNLAHLHSRVRFLLTGNLTRTSAVERHPGDRPLAEYLELLTKAGFAVERRGGIFPTIPFAFRAVNRHPAKLGWLVGVLDAVVPFHGLRFLATVEARKTG